jgi:hypothetical protein
MLARSFVSRVVERKRPQHRKRVAQGGFTFPQLLLYVGLIELRECNIVPLLTPLEMRKRGA